MLYGTFPCLMTSMDRVRGQLRMEMQWWTTFNSAECTPCSKKMRYRSRCCSSSSCCCCCCCRCCCFCCCCCYPTKTIVAVRSMVIQDRLIALISSPLPTLKIASPSTSHTVRNNLTPTKVRSSVGARNSDLDMVSNLAPCQTRNFNLLAITILDYPLRYVPQTTY